MKSVSASAKFNPIVYEKLFSTNDRARDTAEKILAARSSNGRVVSQGLSLTTNKKVVIDVRVKKSTK